MDKFSGLFRSQADCSFEISRLAQATADSFAVDGKKSIRRLTRVVHFAVENPIHVRIAKLDKNSLSVVGSSDSSFGNSYDLTTQLGHIVLVSDRSKSRELVLFTLAKSLRVTRTATAGEVIAFSGQFDTGASTAQELQYVFKCAVPLQLFTESRSILAVISKGSKTLEKRLILYVFAARTSFRETVL